MQAFGAWQAVHAALYIHISGGFLLVPLDFLSFIWLACCAPRDLNRYIKRG